MNPHPNPAAPQRIAARVSIVGEDTPVARALPHRQRRMIGAWCFLDHAGPVQFKPGQGLHVGAHPHIGLQTFTWLIEGAVTHRDSLGHEQVIHPGQVNLMTAGRGIAHTEDSVQDGARLHAAQLWIALPDAERQREPAFQNYPELPVIDQGGWRVTVLAGSLLGRSSPATVYTPLVGLDLASQGAADVTLPLEPGFEYGAMVLRGSASVGGEAITTGELLYFAPGRAELRLQGDAEAQILLLGGQPFGQPVLLWWNFVGRTQDDMAEALADWQASPNQGGRFGTVRPGSTADALTPPVLEKLKVPSAS